jgi:starvation-inducible outer membrane lipoprotein
MSKCVLAIAVFSLAALLSGCETSPVPTAGSASIVATPSADAHPHPAARAARKRLVS